MRGDAALEYLLSRPMLVTPEALEAAVSAVSRDRAGLSPEMLESRRGLKVDGSESGMVRRGSVAVIPVMGPIYRYSDWLVEACGGVTTEALARDLRMAAEDPMVRSILLSVDSPGGEAAGIGELAGMIRAANGSKPVVAYVGNQGCSAAYYLAAASGRVVCAPAAMLGSIGVVMGFTRRDDRPGTKSYEFVSSQSPNKRPDPETESGRAQVQALVDSLAQVFVDDVAAFRGVSAEKVLTDFGRGGMLVGKAAVDAGMADAVGTFEGVLFEMADPEYGRPKPARGQAASASAVGEKSTMFKFLFKPKADGTGLEMIPEAVDSAATPATPAPAKPAESDASRAAQAELQEARRQLALAKVETINVRAESLYNTLFAANLIVPAERAAMTELFVQASIDDLASPLADDKTRSSMVEKLYKARTPHTLTRERVAGEGAASVAPGDLPPGYRAVQQSGDPDRPPTKERLNGLISHLVAAGAASPDVLVK